MSIFHNKKGESLIEVVVSLGIVIMVFSGIMTLIISTVSLNMSARQRTEAITLASSKLNNYFISGLPDSGSGSTSPIDSGTCVIDPPRDLNDPIGADADQCSKAFDSTELAAFFDSDPDKMCDYIVIYDLEPTKTETSAPELLLTTDNYVKAESHVRWYTRSIGVQEYVVTKLVRKR